MFNNLSVVLVNSSHPGNIGAAARAMKAMGVHRLCLVNPNDYPSATANALASGADDILAQARVVATLDEAIAKCKFVVGTSARVRGVSLPLVDPRCCADKILDESSRGDVALVFGREDKGLTNAQLNLCHLQVHIPTNPDFSSLNLGAAVQVLCYELRMARLIASGGVELPTARSCELAVIEDMERFYEHLHETLQILGFLDHGSNEKIMAKLRRLYGRIRLDTVELAMLRGILSETQRCLDKKD